MVIKLITNQIIIPDPDPKPQLEDTTWAQKFLLINPEDYYTAINYAVDPSLQVKITHLNINGDLGYSITVVGDEDFWMGCRYNLQDAIKLCNKMNWNIKDE